MVGEGLAVLALCHVPFRRVLARGAFFLLTDDVRDFLATPGSGSRRDIVRIPPFVGLFTRVEIRRLGAQRF